ncbi:peptide methionine sulfoxide reductase [Campylobacterota bacterium]
MKNTLFHEKVIGLDDGTYDVYAYEKRYLLRKETQLEGKLIKLYAEELGGNDFISLNYYPQLKGGLLKPCEMPQEKVIQFILRLRVSL